MADRDDAAVCFPSLIDLQNAPCSQVCFLLPATPLLGPDPFRGKKRKEAIQKASRGRKVIQARGNICKMQGVMAGGHSEHFSQLQWVEAQLARLDVQLTAAEHELVKNHRLAHLELLQQQLHGLGPVPALPGELATWERRKAEATSEVNLVAESWRLQMPGLSEAWDKFRRVEDLQRLRSVYSLGLADGQQAAPGHLQQGGESHCLFKHAQACVRAPSLGAALTATLRR